MTELEKRTLELFKMLGNHTRYVLIKNLHSGEFNVSHLTELTGKKITTVSKHLRLLKELEIVSFRTVENQVFYSLKKKGLINLIDDAMRIMKRKRK